MGSLTLRTVLTGLDAGFRKGRFVLNNSKQKRKKFLNFHQNFLESEIIFAKRGVAPSERNVTLRSILTSDFFDFEIQVSLINSIKILYFFPLRYLYSAYKIFLM